MAINRELLVLRFQEATGCTTERAAALTQKYLKHCGIQLLQHLQKNTDHLDTTTTGSVYYIDQTALQNSLSTVMTQGKRHYVWRTFQSFPERVFHIRKIGSNYTEKLTLASANYSMEEILLAAGSPEELAQEIYKPYQDQIAKNDYDLVPVDMVSLGNYIRGNVTTTAQRAQHQKELLKNLKYAQRIFMLAAANDDHLLQVISASDFGRKYYKGPNLQNTPKIVRHAALGNCHEYDIELSVFAWKYSEFKRICQILEQRRVLPATLEYLDHKAAIRSRLSHVVFGNEYAGSVAVIKEFITAIGFGAPLRATGYSVRDQYQKPALATIIRSRDHLNRAIADPWVQDFVEEQKILNRLLFTFYESEYDTQWRAVPALLDKANRLRQNSVVAYMYQQHERELLDTIEQFCADDQVLLTVHDCIYTRLPVDLRELRAVIAQHSEWFKIQHKQHRSWTWEQELDPSDPFYDAREYEWARRQQQHGGSHTATDHFDGTGYDACEYDQENDPFFESQQEQY